MTEKATTKATRRNVGEIIKRGRIYYIRYYDLRGRRRLESTHSDVRIPAHHEQPFRSKVNIDSDRW